MIYLRYHISVEDNQRFVLLYSIVTELSSDSERIQGFISVLRKTAINPYILLYRTDDDGGSSDFGKSHA